MKLQDLPAAFAGVGEWRGRRTIHGAAVILNVADAVPAGGAGLMKRRAAADRRRLEKIVDDLASGADSVLAYSPAPADSEVLPGPNRIQFLETPDGRLSLIASFDDLSAPLELPAELSACGMLLLAVANAAGREAGSVTLAAGELILWEDDELTAVELVPVVVEVASEVWLASSGRRLASRWKHEKTDRPTLRQDGRQE